MAGGNDALSITCPTRSGSTMTMTGCSISLWRALERRFFTTTKAMADSRTSQLVRA